MIEEYLKDKARRYWWLKGVLFAISFIALTTSVFDWNSHELLRGLHACILIWNKFPEKVAEIASQVGFLNFLTAGHINALFLLTSLTIPSIPIGFYHGQSTSYKVRFFLGQTILVVAIFFWGGYIFNNYDSPLIAIAVLTPLTLPQLKLLLSRHKSYGRGIVTAFVLLISFEAFYLVSSPKTKEMINEFACSVVENDCE